MNKLCSKRSSGVRRMFRLTVPAGEEVRQMKETSRTFARVSSFSFVLLLVLWSNASSAYAQLVPHLQDQGVWRTATQKVYSQLPDCTAPDCASVADGGDAYTSDYTVSQMVFITGAQNEEAFTWQAIAPDNTVIPVGTMTYTTANGCFTWSTGSICGTQAALKAWWGPSVT